MKEPDQHYPARTQRVQVIPWVGFSDFGESGLCKKSAPPSPRPVISKEEHQPMNDSLGLGIQGLSVHGYY